MRRLLKIMIIMGMIAGLVMAVGCGSGSAGAAATKATGASSSLTAQQILAKVTTAPKMTSGKIDYQVSISLEFDKTNTKSTIPAAVSQMFSQPLTISGTTAFGGSGSDTTLNANISGKALAFGVRTIGDKAYIQYAGKWYDMTSASSTPQSTASQSTASGNAQQYADMLAKMNVSSWLSSPSVVGQENINGVTADHITGNVNVTAMMTALSTMSTSTTAGTSSDSSAQASIQSMMGSLKGIESYFKNFKVDVWVSTKDYSLVKAAMDVRLEPPAGTDNQGLKTIALTGSMTMKDVGQAVTVATPSPVLSSSAFTQALMKDPSLSSILGVASSMTGGLTF